MKQHYDLVIIGGGMVGASLACALLPASERLGLKIAVIEAHPMPQADSLEYQPSYDARATALAYGSRSIYEAMGVWPALSQHLAPIEHIHVSDRGQFGTAHLRASDEQLPALGYVIENHWLGSVLLNHLTHQTSAERVDFLCPAEVTDIRFTPEGNSVDLQMDGSALTLQAELVVMADGGRSPLRDKLGIHYQEHAYQQHALIANLTLDRPHGAVAYERFTDTGPMALLPLTTLASESRVALVWTLPSEQLDGIQALSDEQFIAQVQERFGYRAGRIIKTGQRACYPLKLVVAEEQVRRGLVVLGNAAHALHPIAGQGYNLALRGVAALAEQLIQAREQAKTLGDLQVLQDFYDQQKRDQQRTIDLSDQAMQLFSNRQPLLAAGRSLGLQLLDICPPIKTLFARGAMGLDTPAPRLK
ncbi:2-octaprenyl-6-methoxyphenyl hydroxylase [Pontibacter sp. JAM-7]|uniref:2-octaprenyl-6-methoxyphenyl hydroxylase n=1 Tax=Pontibacter sp. JAM-7 TaxID=3366581 RepID=UPI003AF69440